MTLASSVNPMASKGHIAALREKSLTALNTSTRQIAAALDMEPPDLSIFFRDPDLLHATQLHALALFNERLVLAVHDLNAKLANAARQAAPEADEPPEETKPKTTRTKKGK